MSAFVLSSAGAAGLGKLTVLSALGQPLLAEIELTSVSKEEAGTLVPKLASPEAFQAANIDLHPSLLNLRFAIEQRGGKQYIRVSSSQPMNEPFVDLLLELSAVNGRLVREYTFLLDPPELRTAQSPEVAAPIVLPPAQTARREPAVEAQTQPVTAPVASVAMPAPQPEPQSVPQPAAQAPAVQPPKPAPVAQQPVPVRPAPAATVKAPKQEITAQPGDTLTKLALANKPDGVSLEQMLVALYRTNRDAFSGNNMNRLRAGRILYVPSAEEANAVEQPEAIREIRVQAADFNEYRGKLAGQVAAGDAKPAEESKQSASGKITATVKEKSAPAADAKDKLQLSKSIGGADKGAGKATGVEDKIAKDKARADEEARIKQLEKTNAEMQKLLELKNKAMADKQKQASASASASAAASAPAPAPKPPVPVSVASPGLLDDPMVLGAGGLVIALLGGLGFMAARRRKAAKAPAHDEPLLATDDADPLMDAPAAAPVAAAAVDAAPAKTGNEVVDPIAEADVYIAYGRDEQAEAILKNALDIDPDNHPVRAKLLEIYSSRKDADSYEVQARELHRRTGGEGDLWGKVASAGLALDPSNPLYGGFAPVETAVGDEAELDALLGDKTVAADDHSMDFTSGGGDDMAMNLDALNAIDAPAEEAPAAKSAFDDLDFDLEGLSGDQPLMNKPSAAPAAAAAAGALDDPLANLEFSMDDAAAPAAAPAAAAAEPVPALDAGDINFDFLNDSAAPAAEAAPAATESVTDDVLPPLDDLMPPVEAEAPAAAPAAATEEHDALDLMEADFANLAAASIDKAIPPEPAAAPAAAEPAPMDFDLSDITLDLNPVEEKAAAAPEAPATAPAAEPLLADFNLDTADIDADLGLTKAEPAPAAEDGDYSENAEMATKLDLAIAYEEIGDKEGARELLEEVVAGGTPDQVARAQALLDNLG